MRTLACLLAATAAITGLVFILQPSPTAKAQMLVANTGFGLERSYLFAGLISKARETGKLRVIVEVNADFRPEGLLQRTGIIEQRLRIRSAQEGFLNRYKSFRSDDVKQFDYIPFVALESDPDQLRQMENDPSVLNVEEDIIGEPALAESTQIVGAPTAWTNGYSGAGQTVAILDSGVDKNHVFLSPRVVSEACYSSTVAGSSTSFCPGGASSSTAPDSGLNCLASINGCPHGTNVAGIAAGRGTTFSGVAKDANIIAIQMFSQFTCSGSPCARYWTSDLIRALERVRTLADTINIAAVNLSLQTGQQFTTNCDTAHSATKAAIDNLRSVNVPTVICSGNYSFTNALTAPACISTSISVGSTDDGSLGTLTDVVSDFSDSSPLLHLLAPGRWINSSIPGNLYQNYSGTSMAAPHVVGTFAILRQRKPNSSVGQLLNAAVNSGQPILDTRNNLTKPRIRIPNALTALNQARIDFDGDNRTDVSIFRPSVGEWWYLRSSDGTNRAFRFGGSTDKIIPSDYTGDGKTDIAIFRPSSGEWFILRSEDSSFYSFPFGATGDVPVPVDFDGDRKNDPAIFRSSNATWYILNSLGGTRIQSFGSIGDAPAVGDYDGDGKADLAIFRPANGQWWINRSSDQTTIVYSFGVSTDKIVPADYTGDGKDDVAFFRPSSGEWFILRSENASYYSYPFGQNSDVPVVGDYDGDGKADSAIFRPSNLTWFLLRSTSGSQAVGFGSIGDQPVPSAFVQ